MSDMSDLELVAQAMAPIDNPTVAKQVTNPEAPKAKDSQPPNPDNIDISQIPSLSDIDPKLLESLSLEDRQALLPLLAALQSADSGLDDEDVGDLEEILKQMDQAEGVADELENKLDRLIRELEADEGGLKGEDGEGTLKEELGEKEGGSESKAG